MIMKKIQITLFSLIVISIVMAISGCGPEKQAAVTSDEKPEIVWYLRHDEQKDGNLVLDEMNKIIEKNINATLNIKRIDGANYAEKLKLAMSANEAFDLCHMAPRYNFYTHVSKGAFLPVDDLLAEYAPQTYAQVPNHFWDAAKVDGKLYGIINYQIVGRQGGFVVQKELLEKYNFDLSTVKRLEDIEPFYEAVRQNEPSNVICYPGGGFEWALTHYVGFDTIGSNSYPGVLLTANDDYTVVNQFETSEFMEFAKLMRKWYLEGYIPKDAATISNLTDLKMQGLLVSFIDNVAPGYEPQFAKSLGNRPVETVVIDPPFVNTENVIATMNSVSRTSKNPEKAIEFLELINTDKDGIYNMMCFGIEGKHYNKTKGSHIEKIADSGYDPNAAWMFGNQFNAYLIPGQEEGLWEETIDLNNNATVSKLLGFTFNTEPVKIELAQCEAVIAEYVSSITTGTVDPEEYIPEFLAKLENAGVDKIIAEKQKQIDEWRKTE